MILEVNLMPHPTLGFIGLGLMGDPVSYLSLKGEACESKPG